MIRLNMQNGRVECKRLGGLEAISYDHDAHCIKYKRGLEAIDTLLYQIQATGVIMHHASDGGRRELEAEIVILFVWVLFVANLLTYFSGSSASRHMIL
jgi:hypothetical protein